MNITFSDDAPSFDGSNLVLRFTAYVDSEPVDCAITAESLEDHFGANSPQEDELRRAFERGRARIHAVCARAIEQNDGASVELHSGLFRVERLAQDRGTK
ncbi:DUF1488 domain-containing protein [Paraburkholderia rhizosphaerae]|uniref:Uncharacterized protein DUF1488 n=1 Tax=Paraburkholderia rhizosphaerae TaxID=480658 RepID=A0A4R8L3M8_9BURK|nr:DUF1488 domain-containing protein [Paraburkholderia rhizosphaerae]TDY37063.1 uncharacterized protein DUF1488 [Paraburkholderia rhizosphaerae]